MENEIHKYIIGEDADVSDEMLQSRGSRYGKVYAVMNDFCLKGLEDRLLINRTSKTTYSR